ncbi:hypothetical protein GGR92_000008 [Spirosoma lacussanchae]|uniref:N-acetylmuramidase family protein n=1 Tax=Spirosoma lacussanchae TaxID=1884249 RepID=UPI001109DEAD|nr:N-acetylmuramidase family protein [Spirosoma lacussanchae]
MTTLTLSDYQAAARLLRTGVAEIKAVQQVESRGAGFVRGRLVIRFEGHWFRKLTNRRFDRSHPTISHPYYADGRFNKGGQNGEYDRLRVAMTLDIDAALQSCSWGMFQILGIHYELLGYASVHAMVDDFKTGEAAQLLAFCRFVKAKGIDDELRDHEWDGFALIYNGSNYRAGGYHRKLPKAYEQHVRTAGPPGG